MRAERWKLKNQKERIDMRNTSLEAKNAFDGLMTKKNIARSTELIDRALDMNFLSLLAVNN